MKNTFLIALLLCATSAFAQGPANVVKSNPFGYFAGQYQVGYERALNDNFSVQLQAGILTGTGTVTVTDSVSGEIEIADFTRSGVILIPEARYYPGGNACEGFYIAASGRYRVAKTAANDDPIYDRTAIGGALTLGLQWWNDGMLVDLFVGPQIKNVTTDWHTDGSEEDLGLFGDTSGTGVRFGVNVGFGF